MGAAARGWTTRGKGVPMPEQRTPYLASKCFPWLFTGGRADPFLGARPRGVSFADHVKHLIALC